MIELSIYVLATGWRMAKAKAVQVYSVQDRNLNKTEKVIGFAFSLLPAKRKERLVPYKVVIDRLTGDAISVERVPSMQRTLKEGMKKWK